VKKITEGLKTEPLIRAPLARAVVVRVEMKRICVVVRKRKRSPCEEKEECE